MSAKTKKTLATLGMLLGGIIWGGSFIVMKSAIAEMPINFILAVRFTIAALALCFALFKFRAQLKRGVILGGMLMGLLLYVSFVLQTYGLRYTTSGKNALLTAIYIILVPVFVCLRKRTRLQLRVIIAAVLCFTGVALLCLSGEGSGLNLGDLLSMGSGVAFALHLMVSDKYMEKYNLLVLTCIQFATAGVLSWIACFSIETIPTVFTGTMVWTLAYSAFGATLIAFTLENVGVKYASPELGALMMSTEAPFAVLFGVLFLHELMSGRTIVGCLLVVAAIVICQVDVGRLFKKKAPAVAEALPAEGEGSVEAQQQGQADTEEE